MQPLRPADREPAEDRDERERRQRVARPAVRPVPALHAAEPVRGGLGHGHSPIVERRPPRTGALLRRSAPFITGRPASRLISSLSPYRRASPDAGPSTRTVQL